MDIALNLPAAEAQLRGFSFERLILWYHDQYAKRVAERRGRWSASCTTWCGGTQKATTG
jgi:hypothetical protein